MIADSEGPLRVVVLFSGGASGVRYLAENDPNCGDAYEVVGAFTDAPDAPGVEAVRERGVPVETNDIEAFYDERNADTGDMAVRAEFDRETRRRIERFDPDLLVLSGYMRILTDPLVEAYPIVNVHPADLTVTDGSGERVYTGADSVFDAVTAGEPETRSTVHLVTTDVDAGPILVRSPPFEVHRDLVETVETHGAEDALREYVDAHQEWMKWAGDGPALARALELVAAGRVEREGPGVLIDGQSGYWDLETGEIRS